VAALIQDDIEHIVGYAIIGDAGVILLAIAALDPAAWAPARTWILAFVVARSAFAAWAAATRSVFFTGRLTDLRGWAIRSPALGVILGVVVVASVGVPGLAAFDARGTIVALAIDGPLGALVLLGALSPLLYYGRVLLVGVGRPAGGAASARSLRPVVSPVDLTDLRSWLTRTWSDNLAVTATGGAALLAILALAVSFGAFGASSAAAGLPPTLDVSRESFAPEDPQAPVGSDAPSAPPADGEAGEAPSAPPSDDEPSEAPSAPSPDGSPSGAPSP
jgi:formate hydrogenlyase subunit 3/multisubunit Na+/H+ antiporter MnhD subunit